MESYVLQEVFEKKYYLSYNRKSIEVTTGKLLNVVTREHYPDTIINPKAGECLYLKDVGDYYYIKRVAYGLDGSIYYYINDKVEDTAESLAQKLKLELEVAEYNRTLDMPTVELSWWKELFRWLGGI